MKQAEIPKDKLYFSDNREIRDTLSKLGFLAFDPGFMRDTPLPEGKGMYVAVECEFYGPIAALLVERGAPMERLGFVRWDDENFDPERTFEALLRPEGIFSRDVSDFAGLRQEIDFETYLSGFPALDPCLKWRLPELVAVAGPYGSGKSLLAQLLGAGFVATHGEKLDCKALFCSFEDMPGQIKGDLGRFANTRGIDLYSLWKRVMICVRPAAEERPLSWFLGFVRHCVKEHNVKFVILDPWNELDHSRDMRETETEYVRVVMREFRRLVDELQIILVVVTHVPAKNINPDGTFQQFRIAHAHGSIQFANKADRGICVVRSKALVPGEDRMVIAMDKIKIERLMGRRDVCAMRYDWDAHDLFYDRSASEDVRKAWRM